MSFAVRLRGVRQPVKVVFDVFRVSTDFLDKSPVSLLLVRDSGQLLASDDEQTMSPLIGRAQDDEKALNIFQTSGRSLLDLGTVDEIDVSTFENVSHARCHRFSRNPRSSPSA